MSNPLISIVIPSFNAEKSIPRLINSILKQSYQNYEVILIDDGSIDDTEEAYKKNIGNDCRFLYFYQENSGQGAARNYGIKISKGKYLCFVDADDSISDNYLETLCLKAIEKDADIVLSDVIEVYENPDIRVPKNQQLTGTNYLEFVLPTFHSKLWNREFYISCGVEQPNIKFEDVATVPFFLCKANKIVSASGCSYYYYQDSNSTVNRIETFSHRQKALAFLCNLFTQNNMFETYKEDLFGFLKTRYLADINRFESMIPKINEMCEHAIRNYFNIDPNIFFTNVFIFGSYNMYRSTKYVFGNRISHRFMATTIESVTGNIYKELRDISIKREPILRQENVINDVTKRFMNMNPVECEDVSLFLIDLLDERFNVGYKGDETITISDAYLDDKNALIPERIVVLEDRIELFKQNFNLFFKRY